MKIKIEAGFNDKDKMSHINHLTACVRQIFINEDLADAHTVLMHMLELCIKSAPESYRNEMIRSSVDHLNTLSV